MNMNNILIKLLYIGAPRRINLASLSARRTILSRGIEMKGIRIFTYTIREILLDGEALGAGWFQTCTGRPSTELTQS